MADLKTQCMQFLYKWVTEGKLSNLRKGQVEELETFVINQVSAAELHKASCKMREEGMKARMEARGEVPPDMIGTPASDFDKEQS